MTREVTSHNILDMELHRTLIGPNPRACFLGDIENLAGRPTGPTCDDVRTIAAAVYKTFGHMELHPVVACAHRNAKCVWFNWPEARRLVRSGPDGADLCLLDVIANERIAERFETVIIGSGDNIFSEAAARLATQGTRVIAAIGHGGLSSKLRMAVHDVVRLPLDWQTDQGAITEEVRLSA